MLLELVVGALGLAHDVSKLSSRAPALALGARPLGIGAASLTTTVAMPATAAVVDNPYASGAATFSQNSGGFDLVGSIVNLGLSAAVAGLVLFIIKFAFDALTTMASTPAQARFAEDYEDEDDERAPPKDLSQVGDSMYDDSGTGAYTGPVNPGQKRNIMKSEGGREFAPWMQIDQNRIAQAKAERQKRLKKK